MTTKYPKRHARKPKPGDDPKYLAWLRKRPCLLCYLPFWNWLQTQEIEVQNGLVSMVDELCESGAGHAQETPTEAAHLGKSTSHRGLNQKYPDHEAGPLCNQHHAEHHANTKGFWIRWAALDRDGVLTMLVRIYLAKQT